MATQYSITLSIPQATLTQLVNDGYFLYGFKGVQASQAGAPLVWFSTNSILENNLLTWTEQYSAYMSESVPLTSNTVITASDTCLIGLNQVVTADQTGLGSPTESQNPGISINNTSSPAVSYNCGIALMPPAGTSSQGGNPLCAFPLAPTMTDEMIPVEQVVLMFSTAEVSTGTVLEQSSSWAVLIDLTANNNMSVTYDLTQPGGWVAAPGVTPQQPPVNLVQMLVPTTG
ncbi:MAG TPA: hypothetical protein VK358_12595 [Longimicrobium sp.]|jgi:hypothetical protein|nr:hypothetical protein [Longimicrobium sp.]